MNRFSVVFSILAGLLTIFTSVKAVGPSIAVWQQVPQVVWIGISIALWTILVIYLTTVFLKGWIRRRERERALRELTQREETLERREENSERQDYFRSLQWMIVQTLQHYQYRSQFLGSDGDAEPIHPSGSKDADALLAALDELEIEYPDRTGSLIHFLAKLQGLAKLRDYESARTMRKAQWERTK